MKIGKKISCYNDALHYVNRLGLAGNGTIHCKQYNLAYYLGELLRSSGQNSWNRGTFRPFYVRFERKHRRFFAFVPAADYLGGLK